MLFTICIYAMFLQLTIAAWIRVPNLVNVVATAFTGALTEIERREVWIAIGEQRISHHKILIEFAVTPRDEVRLPCILALKLGKVRIHRGRANLHPDELPVKIEVIVK
jgi:hypothetical protein